MPAPMSATPKVRPTISPGGTIFSISTLSRLLFGIEPFDLPTFGSVIALVLVVATFACALPARWATRVDPTTALRAD